VKHQIQSTSGTTTSGVLHSIPSYSYSTAITNVNITINGVSRTALKNGAGTANSSTFRETIQLFQQL
jgi:hypothetical protein